MKRITLLLALSLVLVSGSAFAAPVNIRLAHAHAPTDDSVLQVDGLKYKALVEPY